MRKCSFADCSREYKSKGYCQAHYMQLRTGKELSKLRFKRSNNEDPWITFNEKTVLSKENFYGGTPCLEWTGALRKGYGAMRIKYRMVQTHRWIYMQWHSMPELEFDVLHHCDNPLCCNPWHLFLGMKPEELADKYGADQTRIKRIVRRENLEPHMKPVTIDFETEAIGSRPDEYPPKPVGVAIWEPSKLPVYLAWGHPTENNSDFRKAKAKLYDYWNGRRPMVFHNAPFDLEVANKWMDLHYPPWHMVHDTQLLAFLHNPHSKNLELKALANDLVDMPPEEQDELREWIFDHVPGAKRAKTQWGKHICKAPGNLVGKYAKGDVLRTRKLFEYFIHDTHMEAYNRERELQPILLRATIRGVPIAKRKLKIDFKTYQKALILVDEAIISRLGAPDLDIDSPKQLVEAIANKNLVEDWIPTPNGGRSVSAAALEKSCRDRKLVQLMNYRGRLKTGLRTFGKSWIEGAYDGRLHFKWNQTAGDDATGKRYGARTGRLSSTPNGQNMPKERPEHSLDGLPPLPHPREYIVPNKGEVLIGRDYSQQELRILAWYLGGPIASAYIKNQSLDMHKLAQQLLKHNYGLNLPRKNVKTIAFGILYGMGVKEMSRRLDVDVKKGEKTIDAYKAMFSGLSNFQYLLKEDQGVMTWGGRWYDVEEPIMSQSYEYSPDGKIIELQKAERTFEYKLLNYGIQGSAADCTKQALINIDSAVEESEFFLTVHDEFLLSCPKGAEKREMQIIEEAMMDVDFSPIKMLSDGKKSGRNWASMRMYK